MKSKLFVFILSQENLTLAQLEAIELLELQKYERQKYRKKYPLIIASISKRNQDKILRLAYTHKVLELLFACTLKQLIAISESFDWSRIYKNNFCIRINNMTAVENMSIGERDVAKYV